MTQTAIRAVVKDEIDFLKIALVYSWLSPRKRWRAGRSLEMKLSVSNKLAQWELLGELYIAGPSSLLFVAGRFPQAVQKSRSQ